MNELLANFHFLRPLWLWGLLPVVPLAWLLYRRLGAGKAWTNIISDELLPHLLSGGRSASRWPLSLVLTAWLLAVIALAGPSWERLPQPVERREHALVVLYDLSLSMYATDVTPSRLVRSRQKLLDLLEKKTEGTTGLIAYAGDAHVVSPLTDDLRTIANLMPALTPDIMPTSGSRPARAVEQAVRLLRDSGLEHGQILLVTDGVHVGDSDEIEEVLRNSRYRLSVLGVGTGDGSPIPTGDGFLRNDDGGIVVARLDRKPLEDLAARFGGTYSDLELGDDDLERILALDPWGEDDTEQLLGRSVDTWEDMGYWLTLLLIPVVLGAFRRGYILCLLLLPLAEPSEAQNLRNYFLNRDQRASELLEEQPEAAAELFRNPDWAAAANYRAGDYDKALEHYSQGENADSWYNRGNSLARGGMLEEAIAAYSKALELAPDMEDAAFNKALLEQLQQQQEQQQQQQDQQNQDDQQQDQQQNQQQDQQSQSGDQSEQQDQAQQEQSDSEAQQQEQQQAQQEQQQAQQEQQEQQQQQQANAEPSEQEPGEQQQQAARERDPDELEREMANEQWLRRIPDDPSGLLRRKFRYESRLRAQENRQGADRDDETRW